jgi:hypothetical protein
MLIIITTWWFWISLIAIVTLMACEATESPILESLSIIIAGVLFYYVADINWIGYIKNNPLEFLMWFVAYFIVGTIWCISKWFFFCLKMRNKFRRVKKSFFKEHGLKGDVVPFTLKESWKHVIIYSSLECPPKIGKHKRGIVSWIVYWPFSAIWTLIDDFIEQLAKTIYRAIHVFLQSISDKIFTNDNVKIGSCDKDCENEPTFACRDDYGGDDWY